VRAFPRDVLPCAPTQLGTTGKWHGSRNRECYHLLIVAQFHNYAEGQMNSLGCRKKKNKNFLKNPEHNKQTNKGRALIDLNWIM